MSALAGKVALVTGGSRGIGRAITRRLAEDGADVALTYASAGDKALALVAEIEAVGRRGLEPQADSADPQAAAGAVERTVAEFGRLDILINNAGISVTGPLEGVTLEEVDRTLAIQVRAAFLAARAPARHMGAGGRIISIGSCLAERVPWPGITLYAVSKSALIGLTQGLARDLGARGVTTNVVHPGPIDTDMNPADGPAAGAERALLASGEFGHADDIAATVVHRAGPGGRFITGAAIAADGGFAA